MLLELGPHRFDVTHRAVVIGIVSASVHGDRDVANDAPERLLVQAARHVEEGADALELRHPGGTPRAPASAQEHIGPVENAEIDWVASMVACLRDRFDVPLTCDTGSASVLAEALAAGAAAGHDHSGFADPDYLATLFRENASVFLTAGRATQPAPPADGSDLVAEVCSLLSDGVTRAEAAGIPTQRIVVDAGFAEGPADQQASRLEASNLMSGCGHLVALSLPTDDRTRGAVDEGGNGVARADPREVGSVAVALAMTGGCRVIRTADVRSARRTASVLSALLQARSES